MLHLKERTENLAGAIRDPREQMREVGRQKAARGPGGIDAVLYSRSGRSGTDHAKKTPSRQSKRTRAGPSEK